MKYIPFVLILTFSFISCNGEDIDSSSDCETDPETSIEDNIIGSWTIDNESNETVTFDSDGTGSSSLVSLYFSTTNNGKDYHNFLWEITDDNKVQITYNYFPDTPTVPNIISENYTVLSNLCDLVEMESFFGSEFTLTK